MQLSFPWSEVRGGDVATIDTPVRWAWVAGAALPTARTAMSSGVINDAIYVIGGLDARGRTSRVVEVYHPQTNHWSRAPNMPEGRHHAASVVIKDRLYVLGGYHGTSFIPEGDVFVFDTTTSSWSRGTSLPETRAAHAAVTINDDLYVVGGVTISGDSSDCLCFYALEEVKGRDIARRAEKDWHHLAPMKVPREHLAAATLQGKLVVVGGRREKRVQASMEIFAAPFDAAPSRFSQNIGTNTKLRRWSSGINMPTARGGAAAASYQNLLVLCGGETATTKPVATVEAYDSIRNRWLTLPSLAIARHDAVAAAVGDTVYVIGGGTAAGLSTSNATECLSLAGLV